jgi:S-adenosylmethionine synthetase
MRNIVVTEITKSIEQHPVELVEHKAVGHPDTICDAVCEEASRALSKYYKENFGHILHHNVDKGLLVAGRSEPRFGGGAIIEPIHITIAGRATNNVNGKLIPVDEIIIDAAKKYIHRNLTALEADHVKLDVEVKPGSGDLQDVFARAKGVPLANDTSFGVGFYPLSETESLVLKVQKLLFGKARKKFPAIGDDIKIMGLRNENQITLTIAIAFIDRYVKNAEEYVAMKKKLTEFLLDEVVHDSERTIKIQINTSDSNNPKNVEDVYLTVTGLSAEIGDDGQVGRGNRVNGLITPNRTMSLEAAAGKNPYNHVGKIYNVLANLIARDIVNEVDGVKEASVQILSAIGQPIDQPQVVNVEVLTDGPLYNGLKAEINAVTNRWLENTNKLTEMFIEGSVSVC